MLPFVAIERPLDMLQITCFSLPIAVHLNTGIPRLVRGIQISVANNPEAPLPSGDDSREGGGRTKFGIRVERGWGEGETNRRAQ
jgi:hypothetical protein